MAYWDFLQMTPENQAAARNMSWGQAIKSEIPGTSNYRGYNPFYKGADATGLGGYLKQGGQSLAGNFQAGSNVGGATPLMRKLAMSPVARGIGTVGRVAGLTNPIGLAATAAYATPKLINKLTEREDPNITGMFGLNINELEDKAAAYDANQTMPGATLTDWASPFGNVPGEEIKETVTDQWTLPQKDWGPVKPDEQGIQDPNFLQSIGQKLGMTQVTDADKLANQQFMEQQGIGVDEQTGRMTTGDFAGKNLPGKSGWGSANFGEMAQAWDDKYGEMAYTTDKMKAKQARIKKQAQEYAAQQQVALQERIRNERAAGSAANRGTQRRAGRGGSHMSRSVEQGGLGITSAQAQSVSDANRSAGMGGWGLAYGGRVGYNEGGRVGILSVF